MKSPDPLEEQRKRELRQGELGAGGLFGWAYISLQFRETGKSSVNEDDYGGQLISALGMQII